MLQILGENFQSPFEEDFHNHLELNLKEMHRGDKQQSPFEGECEVVWNKITMKKIIR